MEIREIRQKEAEDSFYRKGVIRASPRFGKIKVSIGILNRENPKRVLICYPRKDIQEGWLKDFEKWGFDKEVHFQTFRSLSKEVNKEWDFIIIDEIHEASRKQLEVMDQIIEKTKFCLALSGTITQKTEKEIQRYTGLQIIYNYPIELAVSEGVLTDYHIYIHEVELEKQEKIKFRKQERLRSILKDSHKDYFFVELRMINLIQNSDTKRRKTIQLLERFRDERILVFCGVTEIADSLGIPAYHSKARERELFLDFCTGGKEGTNQIVTIKMAQAGVTVKPINKGIINYTSGSSEDTAQKICRFLGMEYDTPDKTAEIHLISSTEPFEKQRLDTALLFFDPTKISFIRD